MVDYYNYKMSGSEDEPESHMQSGMTKAELRRVKRNIEIIVRNFEITVCNRYR